MRERSKLDLVASRKALIDDILHVGDIALVHQNIALKRIGIGSQEVIHVAKRDDTVMIIRIIAG